MENYVSRKHSCVEFGRSDAFGWRGVKRRSANGMPNGDLGPERDLWRQPVLPAQGEVEILRAAAGAGAPAEGVVIPFWAEREVIQRVGCIVDIGDRAD